MLPIAIGGLTGAGSAGPGAATAERPQGGPFGDLLKSAVGSVDRLEDRATTAVEGLLQGNGVDVHDAMIATEKADMAFELTLAVRNKAVAAYQQVMSMQF
jgi:flagellar hook-basal body complex protein FliE